MYIIIAGAGLIGRETTIMLSGNKHDVVVIDLDRDICDKVHAETGVMAIQGSATDIRVLTEAGAGKADVVISVMDSDADNISCALLAKSLGVPRIIARLMDPRYEQAYKLAGVTSVVRMADLLLNRIIMEVEQPRVRKIMVLGGGKAQLYAVKIPDNARSIGMAIRDITLEKKFPKECIFTGVFREEEGEFIFPRGDYMIRGGDTVSLVSTGRFIKPATDFLTRI